MGENRVKCCCEDCYYSGGYSNQDKIADCVCDSNHKREVYFDKLWNKDQYGVKRNSWDEEVECKHFIPKVEPEIEYETIINVITTCPYCGATNELYNQDMEGEEVITCEDCEKQYSAWWCEY